ncbi:hypothetical protein [Paenarthrobacter ilicis]|uniref:hypothetical protein n=1 Tax=Paenarthrobacter ilicis TaxID=43665 RepID=UPI0028D4BFA5|nr:hypothetical protein [Paenarthrobacter ilicis]
MHAESRRKEPSPRERMPGQPAKRRLPDPPDPDNLPIDYLRNDWNPGTYPSRIEPSLRPGKTERHHGSASGTSAHA